MQPRQRAADAVERIDIEVGPLSGVDATQLLQAFNVLRTGSVAAGARLVIEASGVCVECLECGARSDTVANRLVCKTCGGFRTRMIAGDELRLTRVTVRMPDPQPPGTMNVEARNRGCVKPVDAPSDPAPAALP